jgi:toxin-antitoxin system PIN domain toxin
VKLIDLNVLLYAVNEDSVHHVALLRWWEEAANGGDTLGLPWVVLLGFLRLSTSPTVFPRPLDADTAIGKIDSWLALEKTRLVHEKEEHWEILRSLLATTGTAGNLTTDAHLAALTISHGAVLISCDGDFARFQGLRWENPIA